MTDSSHLPYWLFPGIFLLSAGLVWLLARLAEKVGWIDYPSTRKHHRHPIPVVGGLAIWGAFLAGVLLLPEKPWDASIMLVSMTLLTLVGFYDDRRHIRPGLRFMFQGFAVVIMGLADQSQLMDLGDLFGLGQVHMGWAAMWFTIFAVIGIINAFNMMDGLDGLAGGLTLIVIGWLIILCLVVPVVFPGRIDTLLVLAMAIAGFLVYNLRTPWRKLASVFMGDAGSTLLGFVVAWFMVRMSQGEPVVLEPITAVWIVGLPLMDTVAVMARRMSFGCSPFAADRQHLHHLLLGSGLTDGRVVALMLAASFCLGGLGVLAQGLAMPEALRFYGFLALFLAYYVFTTKVEQRRRRNRAEVKKDRRNEAPRHGDGNKSVTRA
jgi:UDP-GlcNAc:undecaprenyl-phosphate/decaprenyl-phosphate GlcNAc-1-phosphate transferase